MRPLGPSPRRCVGNILDGADASKLGPTETCVFTLRHDALASATSYVVNGCCNYLTLAGVEFRGEAGAPRAVPLAAGSRLRWRSDRTPTDGRPAAFELCANQTELARPPLAPPSLPHRPHEPGGREASPPPLSSRKYHLLTSGTCERHVETVAECTAAAAPFAASPLRLVQPYAREQGLVVSPWMNPLGCYASSGYLRFNHAGINRIVACSVSAVCVCVGGAAPSPPPAVRGPRWTVVSGSEYCSLTDGGACLSDGQGCAPHYNTRV